MLVIRGAYIQGAYIRDFTVFVFTAAVDILKVNKQKE